MNYTVLDFHTVFKKSNQTTVEILRSTVWLDFGYSDSYDNRNKFNNHWTFSKNSFERFLWEYKLNVYIWYPII